MSSKKKKNNGAGSTEYYSAKELKARFLIDDYLLNRFFPQPVRTPLTVDGTRGELVWPSKTVENTVCSREFLAEYHRRLQRYSGGKKRAEIRKQLEKAGPLRYLMSGVGRSRRFILHVGPTNSGKTYHALQALKQAGSGVYLGPLRLLALEVFDTFNGDRPCCSLLTGEESEEIPGARFVASTIEMCDYTKHYDVAVIDECQMISDSHRGANWTKAIFQIDADEIHLCMAPEALELFTSLLRTACAHYEIHSYRQLAPLEYAGELRSLSEAQPGDALIAFSRKKVLAIAAELEDNGIRTSVLYGSLPPMARREEVRRFVSGESSVVVATDAIGMGVSLPIRRVVFCEAVKNDGTGFRKLTDSEIRQIAGRAGRYGKFERGEVLTMVMPERIESSLTRPAPLLKRISVPFPRELIRDGVDLRLYLEEWERLLPQEGIVRERTDAALFLLRSLGRRYDGISAEMLFRLVTCPFSVYDRRLVGYWRRCCDAIVYDTALPQPYFGEKDLDACEVQYRAHEIRYRLAQAFGLGDRFAEERTRLCVKINSLLAESKELYILRCRDCGRRLPATHYGLVCARCREKAESGRSFFAQPYPAMASTIGNTAHFTRWKDADDKNGRRLQCASD